MAQKLLGISAAQAERLFIGCRWPLRFCRQYRAEPSNLREFKHNARVTHARVEHFIEREDLAFMAINRSKKTRTKLVSPEEFTLRGTAALDAVIQIAEERNGYLEKEDIAAA